MWQVAAITSCLIEVTPSSRGEGDSDAHNISHPPPSFTASTNATNITMSQNNYISLSHSLILSLHAHGQT